MRKLTSLAVACLFMSSATSLAVAQGFTNVSSIELAPEDAEAFAAQVAIVAEAAAEAGLPAAYAWGTYRWDNTFWFVSNESTLANLEDPEAFMRAWQETSVADKVMAAFQKVEGMEVLSSSQSISRGRPDLSYNPANPAVGPDSPPGGVYVIEQWVKGGAMPAFEESAKGLMAMLGEMDGPYPVFVAQDVIGDGGISFVVIYDNLSNFFGANSLEEGLMSSGLGPKWVEHANAHSQLISRTQSQILEYMPGLSYQVAPN